MRLCLIVCGVMLAAAPALADQCSWNEKPVIDKALPLLPVGGTVQEFCRSCGDKSAKAIRIAKVETKPVDKTNYQISLNGSSVDLAYLFVQQKGSKTWTNLGQLVACDTTFDDKTLPTNLVGT